MKKMLFLALIYATALSAMDVTYSISYDATDITIVNQCPYPITVKFDGSKPKNGVETANYQFKKEDANVTHLIYAQTTENAYFMRLVEYKNGINSVLSKLRATIYQNNVKVTVEHNAPHLIPIKQTNIDLNPDSTTQKLVVSPQNGLTATVEEIPEAQ